MDKPLIVCDLNPVYMNSEPLSVGIFKLDLKPGEMLIAKVPPDTPADTMRQFKAYLRESVPDGVRVVVVPNNIEFVVPGR